MQAIEYTKSGPIFNDTTEIFKYRQVFVPNCIEDYPALKVVLRESKCYYNSLKIPFFSISYLHVSEDLVYMKFLKTLEDGESRTWDEIARAALPDKSIGTDIDSFKSLIPHFVGQNGKRGRKFLYNITPAGKDLLAVAKENMVYYRVARWFAPKIGDVCEYVMNRQLKTGDASFYYDDVTDDAALDLVKALLDTKSRIHKIGSAYRFLRNFFGLVNRNDQFFDLINCEKVNRWLEENENMKLEIQEFKKKFAKAQKKWAKKRAA